jgi:RNA methyltransferase, TrmH family
MNKIKKITSRDNQRLVHARKVRDGKILEQIFIEGRRLAEEALRSDLTIVECFVSDDLTDNGMLNEITAQGISIVEISNRMFASIADTKQPQGIILIAKRPNTLLSAIGTGLTTSSLPLVIFLKEINNPANLGAILRSAEAAGVAGAIVSQNSADVFLPKSLRAAMGSSFRLPILENADFEAIMHWAKNAGLSSTAAAANAANNYADIDWRKPRLLVFGSEAHGLSNLELQLVEEVIHIPMENGVESLNLAVSAGVILFEAKQQAAND